MYRLIAISLAIVFAASASLAQTTGFTYQGRLTDSGTPANGVYDLQFSLWDSQSSGNQIGSTQSVDSVEVTSGVFTVTLDFGANAFPGASRFLAISAKVSGPGSFTLLTPRQPITSTPYAVRSLNAATADTIPAGGVPVGSNNYIQNRSSQQTSSNFNISGNGTASGTLSGSTVNAATQFNLNGTRMLSIPGTANSGNLAVGINSAQNTTGINNSMFGSASGSANTTGNSNSFFGHFAGANNTAGSGNSFIGSGAGSANQLGSNNVFVGAGVASSNTTGASNVFVGGNTEFVSGAGTTFFHTGHLNQTGSNNTLIGSGADVGSGNLSNATAIGSLARVSQSNSLVLGSINLVNGATADTNVGIGTTSPQAPLHVTAKSGNILLGNAECGAGFGTIGFSSFVFNCTNYALMGGDGNTYINRYLGGTIIFREVNGPNQVEIRSGGTVGLAVLGSAGSTALCLNSIRAISTCSSSLRYKTDVRPFASGLQLISRLQPVSFNWKANQQPDIGLIAEDVAKIEPRLTFKNQNGEIEGVNYSQLTTVLINAIKEQQNQIEQLKREVHQLRKTLRHKHHQPARQR